MMRKMVGNWKPFLVPRVQYFAWTGVSVQKVVTVEKSVMKVELFGAITRLDIVFFKELTDAKVTFEKKNVWVSKIQMYFLYCIGVCAKSCNS